MTIAKLRELWHGATAGVWAVHSKMVYGHTTSGLCMATEQICATKPDGKIFHICDKTWKGDMRFIPAAHNSFDALLTLAEATQEISLCGIKDIEGLKYVEVQIDRKQWAEFKAALDAVEKSGGGE